jgi:hypothetical protein
VSTNNNQSNHKQASNQSSNHLPFGEPSTQTSQLNPMMMVSGAAFFRCDCYFFLRVVVVSLLLLGAGGER